MHCQLLLHFKDFQLCRRTKLNLTFMRVSTESNKSNDIARQGEGEGKDRDEASTPRQPAAASWELCAHPVLHSAMSFGYSNIPVAISIHILTELN